MRRVPSGALSTLTEKRSKTEKDAIPFGNIRRVWQHFPDRHRDQVAITGTRPHGVAVIPRTLQTGPAPQVGDRWRHSHFGGSALPSNEALYHSLVNALPHCVVCKDNQGRIIFGNPYFWEMLQLTAEQVLGKTDFDLYPQELAEKYRRDELYVMAHHEPLQVVEEFSTPRTRVTRAIRSIKTPFYDEDDITAGVQIVFWDITDARAADEHAGMFSRVIEQSPVSMLVTNPDGVIEYVNSRFSQVTGYTAQEVIGKKPSIMKSGHTAPKEYDRLWQTIKAGNPWRGEFLNRKKNGELYWEAVSISPVRSDNGEISHYVAVREDISGLRQAQHSLRRQKEYLDSLHETTIGLMGRLELNELMQAITLRAATLVGTTHAYMYLLEQNRDEMEMNVGIGIFEQMVGTQARFGIGLTGTVWQTEKPLVLEDYQTWHGHLKKQGVEQVHAIIGVPIKSGNQTVGIFGVAHREPNNYFDETDVEILSRFADLASVALDNARLYAAAQTEIQQRRRVNEQLRESEAQLRQLFEASPDAILLVDPHAPDGTWPIVDCNQVACQMNGYTRDELIGSSIDLLNLAPDTAEERNAYLERVQREQVIRLETMRRHRDGHIFPIETSTSILRVGTRELLLGIDRDITERKQIERLKNEFIATVSHELRTPLTAIRGSLGLIAGGRTGPIPARAKTMLDIALKNSERLVRLINDILDIEKIESGKMVFEMQPIELIPLIQAVVDDNRSFAEQFQVSLVITQALPGAMINANADRINQVLTNLIANACKFSPPGSQVEICVTEKDDMMQVSVRDYGPGVSPEFQERIFQKFAQAGGSGTRQKGGTGLGLSISKAIIETHNGKIGFTTAPGQGAIFYFQIPGWVVPASTNVPPALPQAQTPGNRILICEDDADAAALLRLVLTQNGYETEIAPDAAHARALLAEKQYAVLTLDLLLPDADGITLIRELRAVPATRHLPIVVVSAIAGEGRAQLNGDAIWVADWLQKPIEQEQLVRAVTNAAQTMRNAKPRILHVEADADVQQVVNAVLGDIATVTQVQNSAQARTLLGSQTFDLVLVDSGTPSTLGMDFVPMLVQSKSQIPVVIFSDGKEEPQILQQVSSVLVKSKTSNEQLLNTITHLIQAQNGRAENA